jgi:quercetin dioxygenase-like cupin family protein
MQVNKVNWDDLPKEHVNDLLDRRLITGKNLMLAHVYLKKGCIVPLHSHSNEQVTYILEGETLFWLGSEDSEPIRLAAGDVLVIPSDTPHKAEALEDTLDLDVFNPPREDWLNRTDDYLRR